MAGSDETGEKKQEGRPAAEKGVEQGRETLPVGNMKWTKKGEIIQE